MLGKEDLKELEFTCLNLIKEFPSSQVRYLAEMLEGFEGDKVDLNEGILIFTLLKKGNGLSGTVLSKYAYRNFTNGSNDMQKCLNSLIEKGIVYKSTLPSGKGFMYHVFKPTKDFLSFTKPVPIGIEDKDKDIHTCPLCFYGFIDKDRYDRYKSLIGNKLEKDRIEFSSLELEAIEYAKDNEKEDAFYIPDGSIMDILTSKGEKDEDI